MSREVPPLAVQGAGRVQHCSGSAPTPAYTRAALKSAFKRCYPLPGASSAAGASAAAAGGSAAAAGGSAAAAGGSAAAAGGSAAAEPLATVGTAAGPAPPSEAVQGTAESHSGPAASGAAVYATASDGKQAALCDHFDGMLAQVSAL